MPALSKTGLLPSMRKKIRIEVQPRTTFDVQNLAVPAPFVLRPFAGIYNPFPYGCSVLCNHPADLEAKNVVKKAKDTWAIEGRGLLTAEDISAIKCKKFRRYQNRGTDRQCDNGNSVPEELFRRYTDTDSRPVTPTPTVVSLSTKHSQILRKRRCMTPDPVSTCPTKERMMLILDLRRSHSQETITWVGSLKETVAKVQSTTMTSRTTSSSSSPKKKKKQGIRSEFPTPTSGHSADQRSSKLDTQRDVKSNRSGKQLHDSTTLSMPQESVELKIQRNSGNSTETEVIKRRGKKKKGKKGHSKEGEKEFKGFPEPGETQVSTLGNESRVGSTRPSLTTGIGVSGDQAEGDRLAEDVERTPSKKDSFLDEAILKQLQRQLDQEVVESELNVTKKIALEEALRLAPKRKLARQNQEIKALRNEFKVAASNPEKWLSIPRVFTRRSARFELPLDSRTLNDMTPLQYAENFVFPSEERLVLYNHVYNIHREELDDDNDDDAERILLGENVTPALGDVVGRPMSNQEADDYRKLIGWSEECALDFRTFAGIAAICERLMAHCFCSEMPSPDEDLKHEVERADFETLDCRLENVHADERIVRILKGIRDL